MKVEKEMLNGGIKPDEYSHISHVVCSADFNTNYPASNRINRIASEINEYLRYKNKRAKSVSENYTE